MDIGSCLPEILPVFLDARRSLQCGLADEKFIPRLLYGCSPLSKSESLEVGDSLLLWIPATQPTAVNLCPCEPKPSFDDRYLVVFAFPAFSRDRKAKQNEMGSSPRQLRSPGLVEVADPHLL